MFVLSSSWLPTLVAVFVFLLALYYKRATFRTTDIVAFALVATVLFFLLSDALNALHLPNVAIHLF